MKEHSFELFAVYFQFYLQDDASQEEHDLDGYDAAQTTRVVSQDTRFVVLTARNMDVPVTVVIADSAPAFDPEVWDHIVELSVTAASGKLAIAGCTDYLPEAARIDVPKTPLRVRVLFGDLDKLSEDQLDGDDHYRIEIWPAALAPVEVIKQH